jgi:phosphomannomutase
MDNSRILMVSTSGIRGVIGNGLDPEMVTRYAAAFGLILGKGKIILGRDSRPSGEIFRMAVIAGLQAVGRDVIDIGIVPTPTVEIAITGLRAAGGICITASHNPSEWNALKFFNKNGEFINKADLEKIKAIYNSELIPYSAFNKLGKLINDYSWIDRHINHILKLKPINVPLIKKRRLKVVVDAINGAGSVALPRLLEKLGAKVYKINCQGDGNFVHNPEPVPSHLKELARAVKKYKADLGLACDPDADRLALVDETGRPLSEELTLALATKFIVSKRRGNVVVNLSTSRVTESAALEYNCRIFYTPVGEANVIEGIKANRAVVGGEGNGGVIYPAFHCGRDSLVGAAFILALMADSKMKLSELSGTLPIYHIIKNKAPLPEDLKQKLIRVEEEAHKSFEELKIDRRDGIRFDFSRGWFQIRLSNTEPIYRLIVETDSKKLTNIIKEEIIKLLQ